MAFNHRGGGPQRQGVPMRYLSTFAASLLFATAAQAHSGSESASGAAHATLHAIGGPDHLLAWLGVGLLGVALALVPLFAKNLARSFGPRKTAVSSRRPTRTR